MYQSVITLEPTTIEPADSLIIPVIAVGVLSKPSTVSPTINRPLRYTIVNLSFLELKSTTLALAFEVLPVTILPVAKNVGSTKVIEGRTGSLSSRDSYTA